MSTPLILNGWDNMLILKKAILYHDESVFVIWKGEYDICLVKFYRKRMISVDDPHSYGLSDDVFKRFNPYYIGWYFSRNLTIEE